MPRNPRAGFTLIELLVVILILGLLVAAFAPDIFGAQQRAEKAADQANLKWHYQQFIEYNTRYRSLPRGSGHKFVLDPWVRGIVQRTPKNFDRYWIPGLPDPRKDELAAMDPEQIWRDLDGLRSTDTHYAGPSSEVRESRVRLIPDGKQSLMADDNEFGPSFIDHTVNVLMGDGTVYEIKRDEIEQYGYSLEGEGAYCPVGPESPHPLLQKLEP
jgi:prepilin-type N-terminal cleavage/methylation domain-containing protein